MTRFNELKRIETALQTKDKDELLWSKEYCEMRVNTAFEFHPKKIAKQAQKDWQKRLNKIEELLEVL